ncbi:hypothetical protein KFE25_008431 [Diacronema lutheri]|uniref:ATP-grasp domain-containing protein n=2 Tax=Diacronema lutheri TaxID=2081491 RepID=A0A8J6C2P1_DIALT|nr:hypothetical protein KFE25_008431 [Diacronema lutheri]
MLAIVSLLAFERLDSRARGGVRQASMCAMPSRLRGGGAPLVLAVDTVGSYADELNNECAARGGRLVQVWSTEFADGELAGDELTDEERADLLQNRAPEPSCELEWAQRRFGGAGNIAAVVCVSDHGLATSERLASALGVNGNGVLPARRDKLAMAEAVRAAGLESVRQCLALDWESAAAFVRQHLPPGAPCVLKPRRGVASVGVYKASSLHEARAAFIALRGLPVSSDSAVSVREGVLVQECVEGREYAVDTASRRGEHKVVHLWRYDKRELNGAHFVYQATILCDGLSSEEERVMRYAQHVLDALRVRDGPAHLEVRAAAPPRGPVLIEANVGRWHGVPYSASLGNLAQGYNAFGAVMDACLDADAWGRLPATPALRAHARMVHLVLSGVGRVLSVNLPQPGDADLPSLVEAEAKYEPGDMVVRPSTDLKSDGGHLLLVSCDAATVEADYAVVLERQPTFFELKPEETERSSIGGVACDIPSYVRALLAADSDSSKAGG